MDKKTLFKIQFLFLLILGGIFVFSANVQAAALNEQINFFIDSTYDQYSRERVPATLRTIGDFIYIYVENDYYNELTATEKNDLKSKLRTLADEFDTVIYPKERAVFGSEWTPGIDNDVRITLLVTQLVSNAGGYINTHDEFPREKISTSNEREMIYLNSKAINHPLNKSYLAHEFQHLISFYQKNVLHNIEEEVWLNEARSEYAPTLCGYDDVYPGSYLADRVDTFLDSPTDSLTEWRNRSADYGAVSLFIHYLVDHYGEEILTRMVLSSRVGIESVNIALAELGYQDNFDNVFADWAVANYLNDCQVSPKNTYCYLNNNLTHQRIHTDYTSSYSGFPDLMVARSSAVKDWSPRWYQFRQGSVVATEKDTLRLEFAGSYQRGDFNVAYIVIEDDKTMVYFMGLDEYQQATVNIPNFTSRNKTVVLIPINQYKRKSFGSNDSLSTFTFTAASIATDLPVIAYLSPDSGSLGGGFDIEINGNNLDSVGKIIFGGITIDNFEIINDQKIKFTAPAHSAENVIITLFDQEGNPVSLNDAFTYLPEGNPGNPGDYPDGSLLRAKGGYKVYIIEGNYKRWVQRAEIFNAYAHLRWEDIIEVEPEVLAEYQQSWLIREINDSKVYEVNEDGTKHWLNMTAEQFSISGRLWDMVYIVNSFERDFYQTGSDVRFD